MLANFFSTLGHKPHNRRDRRGVANCRGS